MAKERNDAIIEQIRKIRIARKFRDTALPPGNSVIKDQINESIKGEIDKLKHMIDAELNSE